MLVLAFVLYPDRNGLVNLIQDSFSIASDNRLLKARIAGQVDSADLSRNEVTLLIYGETIEIPHQNPLYSEIEAILSEDRMVSTIQIDGYFRIRGDALRFDSIDYAEIDGRELNLEAGSE